MIAFRQFCLVFVLLWGFPVPQVLAQTFSSGSDGSDGEINITANTTLDLPPDGIFRATTITVAAGVTLRFNRNALNTPVYLLATGDIMLRGQINIMGQSGTALLGGLGGPGGFDGGNPGVAGLPPGDGFGPGGGLGEAEGASPGRGAYGELPSAPTPRDGVPYGSPLLIPLVGGSGQGGRVGRGGDGGSGAILLASNTRVHVSGSGSIAGSGFDALHLGGSGGAIRIVAPIVSGEGFVDVRNIFNKSVQDGGAGRIRIDTFDRSALNLRIGGVTSIGSFMVVFLDTIPRLDVIAAAGQAIPEGTSSPVNILLPFNASTSQMVTIQARDFSGIVPINIVLTPESGARTVIPAEINMNTGNPATVTVPVELPVNIVTHIHVWTR